MILGGCSGSAGVQSTKHPVTVSDVILNTTKQMNKIHNMAIKMNMAIDLKAGASTSEQEVQTNSSYFKDQSLIYQTMQFKVNSSGSNQTIHMEQYINDQAVYMKGTNLKQWIKVPFSGSDGKLMKDSLKRQSDPAQQLSKKNMKLQKSGTNYVIRFSGQKKELQQFVQQALMKKSG